MGVRTGEKRWPPVSLADLDVQAGAAWEWAVGQPDVTGFRVVLTEIAQGGRPVLEVSFVVVDADARYECVERFEAYRRAGQDAAEWTRGVLKRRAGDVRRTAAEARKAAARAARERRVRG